MRRTIHQAVLKAMVNSRLDGDHPMRDVFESEAQIVGQPGLGCVRAVDGQGNWIRLEARIEELQSDPRFRDSVPNPAKVAHGDKSGIRDHFNEIAAGTTVVE